MAKKRSQKNNVPKSISPFVWGYITTLKKNKVPLEQVYLFGSWAKGNPHKWSDIDLAIVSPAFYSWQRQRRLLSKAMFTDFSAIEAHGIHPKDFTPEDNPIVAEILEHGIRVM
ncbi:MAG: nucleotidyltransferase domain-containing protein [Patescibacteria group bacterium]